MTPEDAYQAQPSFEGFKTVDRFSLVAHLIFSDPATAPVYSILPFHVGLLAHRPVSSILFCYFLRSTCSPTVVAVRSVVSPSLLCSVS
jgi:hypothetical protein